MLSSSSSSSSSSAAASSSSAPSASASVASSTPLPPARERRFDSMATLIQGNDVVSAVLFDGKTILYATNKPSKSALITRITEFLSDIAIQSEAHARKTFTGAEEENAAFTAFVAKQIHAIDVVCAQILREDNIALLAKSDNADRYKLTLQKVVNSLIAAYLKPEKAHYKPLDRDLADAIRGKTI
ncbi:hypothetical protein BH10PSE19_BH10PSE19_22830 [soil metagenome]